MQLLARLEVDTSTSLRSLLVVDCPVYKILLDRQCQQFPLRDSVYLC